MNQRKEGQGAIFKNRNRTKDTQPEYTGNVLINGIDMDIAAWVKEGKNGKFFSLNIKPNRKQQSNNPEDDIPF